MPRRKYVVTIEELRRKFPLGATVFFKGAPIGTVCGYSTRTPEPEVCYVSSKIDKQRYPQNAIGQFTVRSPHFRTRAFELDVHIPHISGIGSHRIQTLTVWFNPRDQFEYGKVWLDETNRRWAINQADLHKVMR